MGGLDGRCFYIVPMLRRATPREHHEALCFNAKVDHIFSLHPRVGTVLPKKLPRGRVRVVRFESHHAISKSIPATFHRESWY